MFQHIGAGAYKPGMGNILAMDEKYGHPHQSFKTIHIAGTNGKGSVSHMLAGIFQEAGYRTGLFTSPHLKDFRERIRINGKMIPEQEVIDFTASGKDYFESIHPSFFEITTLMAMDWFARSKVDIAIIEVGMGGRLDSTNLITPLVSVITQIGKDHTEFLGSTLEQIAEEKAGIIKPGIPVVIGETQPETELVFRRKALENQSPVYFADQIFHLEKSEVSRDSLQHFYIEHQGITRKISIDLPGIYQQKNILTVLCVFEALKNTSFPAVSETTITEGLHLAAYHTGLRGRWEVLGRSPLIICDTAHNEAGLQYVTRQLQNTPHQKLHLVLGFVKEKNIDPILPLFPADALYYFTQPPVDRALPVEKLAQKALLTGRTGKTFTTVKEALANARENAAPEDLIFVGGSNFIVAEVI